jgi:hypothetical protein
MKVSHCSDAKRKRQKEEDVETTTPKTIVNEMSQRKIGGVIFAVATGNWWY